MFDLFKKKEDCSQVEVLRKDRVGKNVRRPKTAPAALGASSRSAGSPMGSPVGRHSADGGLLSQRTLHGSPELLPSPYEPSGSQTRLTKELPAPPSRPTLGGPPVTDRSLSGTSYELRNPFRSDTNDSITTTSMSRASSFSEPVTPVQRTVMAQFPEQIEGTMDYLPLKAAIFTTPAQGLGIITDPFSDESSGTEDSILSTTPTASSFHSAIDDSGSATPKRSRWSFLKSPKHSAQDFLQVHIPSGVLSPPTRQRHAFWSRA